MVSKDEKAQLLRNVAELLHDTSKKGIYQDQIHSILSRDTNGTFWECSALTTLPENFYVGENVTDLGNIFSLCYNLTDEITINCNPTIYDNAIYQTQVTGINGSCNAVTKQNIMATK